MFTSSKSQKEDRKRGAKRVFKKTMTENFPNLVKTQNLQIKVAGQTSNQINPKTSTPRHKITKFLIRQKKKKTESREKQHIAIRKYQLK